MSAHDESQEEESFYKSKYYFDLKDAAQDVKFEFQCGDAADKVKASAKMVGKSVFNIGLLAGKVGIEAVKRMPDAVVKISEIQLRSNKNLTEEQRSKLESIVEKGRR